jgi:hypothetical protein
MAREDVTRHMRPGFLAGEGIENIEEEKMTDPEPERKPKPSPAPLPNRTEAEIVCLANAFTNDPFAGQRATRIDDLLFQYVEAALTALVNQAKAIQEDTAEDQAEQFVAIHSLLFEQAIRLFEAGQRSKDLEAKILEAAGLGRAGAPNDFLPAS